MTIYRVHFFSPLSCSFESMNFFLIILSFGPGHSETWGCLSYLYLAAIIAALSNASDAPHQTIFALTQTNTKWDLAGVNFLTNNTNNNSSKPKSIALSTVTFFYFILFCCVVILLIGFQFKLESLHISWNAFRWSAESIGKRQLVYNYGPMRCVFRLRLISKT